MPSKKTVIKESVASEFTAGKALFYTLLIGGTIVGVGYLSKKMGQQNASNDLIDDVNVQLATRIRNALTPNWLKGGTDEAALFAVAPLISDFNKVSAAYAKLYGRNLTQDLDAELDPSELQQFLQAAQQGKRDAQYRALGRIPTPTGYLMGINSMTFGGISYKPGDIVKFRGIAGPYYNSVDRYPLSYAGLNYKGSGNAQLLQIYRYSDDLDSSKNTYLFKVKQGNTTIWQRIGAFTK